MKRLHKAVVALTVMCAVLAVLVMPAQARPLMPGDPEVRIIKFQIGSKQYTVQDGTGPVQTFEMDVAPYTKKLGAGMRVMLPARFVVEAMGGEAKYNEKTKEIGLFRCYIQNGKPYDPEEHIRSMRMNGEEN